MMTMTGVNMSIECVQPDWDVPAHVHGCSTTRISGRSQGRWSGLNLGDHVADDPAAVAANRKLLTTSLSLPAEPLWLSQVHGVDVVSEPATDSPVCADAAFSRRPGRVCVVLTADCLPVLFCNRAGTQVAAAHAGWRGLSAGVLEQTLARFADDPADVSVWFGPAIGPQAFEVGDDVRDVFVGAMPRAGAAFMANRPGHWLADIYQLAEMRLRQQGVQSISGGNLCTYSDKQRFYSYRRDGVTGRMATLIWMDD